MSSERDMITFLAGLALLLGVACWLGDLARSRRIPAVVGELAAGILLGPSCLGRIGHGALPAALTRGVPGQMLGGYTLVASILLLLAAGFEVDLGAVLRRRRQAALTSIAGIALPLALGVGLGELLPEHYVVGGHRGVFALFLGTALSISAMPVIAKTLLDLGLMRRELGRVVMAAATIDDLAGWLLFSLLVAPMHGASVEWGAFALRALGVAAFVAVVLVVGRRWIARGFAFLERRPLGPSGRALSLLFVLAVLGAAATESLGVHAVFGAFVVGVAAGNTPGLGASTRAAVHGLVNDVFAPVFFAVVGLRVDFVGAFDWRLVLAVLAVASVAKVIGCSLGAKLGGASGRTAWAIGFAMNSRGAMEILLAVVALEAKLIGAELFVALVVMALVTSVISGPVMTRLLDRGAPEAASQRRGGQFQLRFQQPVASEQPSEIAAK